MSFIFASALGLFIFRSLLKYILASLWVSRYQNNIRSTSILWMGLTGQGVLAAGVALEYRLYIPHMPSVFVLFIILLILNQIAIGTYVLKTEKSNKPEITVNA